MRLRIFSKSGERKALIDHGHNDFVYISMTNVLLKKVIESLSSTILFEQGFPKNTIKKKAMRDIRKNLLSRYKNFMELKELSSYAQTRSFDNFTPDQFQRYEDYLSNLQHTRSAIAGFLGSADLIGEILQDLGG